MGVWAWQPHTAHLCGLRPPSRDPQGSSRTALGALGGAAQNGGAGGPPDSSQDVGTGKGEADCRTKVTVIVRCSAFGRWGRDMGGAS